MFENPRRWLPPYWNIEKLPYSSNGLIDLHDIWDSRQIGKITISQQQFDQYPGNLVQ